MPDKGLHISDISDSFFRFNIANGEMPLKLRPKSPHYVVLFVLYEFCVVCVFFLCVV